MEMRSEHPQPGRAEGVAVDRKVHSNLTAEAPAGPRNLTEVLAELARLLPRLAEALERQVRPAPLAHRKPAAAAKCGISVRHWERLLSAGKAPRPDAHAGRCPLWTTQTLERWLAQGGSR
jgi:hypothetical protein